MDQLPNWLTAAVLAAGMTAYADDLDRKYTKAAPTPPAAPAPDEPTPPVH
jgi:hypothetical protein